jgi:hypothetical protein
VLGKCLVRGEPARVDFLMYMVEFRGHATLLKVTDMAVGPEYPSEVTSPALICTWYEHVPQSSCVGSLVSMPGDGGTFKRWSVLQAD